MTKPSRPAVLARHRRLSPLLAYALAATVAALTWAMLLFALL